MKPTELAELFGGKTILVTGGTGSIGSEIVRQLLRYGPRSVRVFSRDEGKQFEMAHRFQDRSELRFLIGDVRDRDRVFYAMKGVDIVFHTAALKHVPLCEYNPFEAVKTNVLGTQHVIEAAIAHNVERVVTISTDKVVCPVNTMGATKLLAEKLIQAAEEFKGAARTKFSSVRFGNVLGSRGSVLPLFVRQIREEKRLTLTHPDMTRFFMSVSQAVELVFRAVQLMRGGEVFVLKMPAVRMGDLVEELIALLAPGENIEIVKIGLRPGEKMHEELFSAEEADRVWEGENMYIIPALRRNWVVPDGFFPSARRFLVSNDPNLLLPPSQVRELLKVFLKNTTFY